MDNVKKSIVERTRHKRLYNRRVNKRQMQKQENKVDLGKALDVDLVVTKSVGLVLEPFSLLEDLKIQSLSVNKLKTVQLELAEDTLALVL
ncbi:hypothetical protein Tco_0996199 [Tanacetum coccineum]